MQKVLSPDIEVTSVPPPLSVASHPGWRLCLPQAVGQLKYTVWSSLYTQYIAIATRVGAGRKSGMAEWWNGGIAE